MTQVGFTDEEIDVAAPTRSARLKWVLVVRDDVAGGRAVNAAACVAAAAGAAIAGLLGPDAVDAAGAVHPGLPWAGCSVLSGPGERLVALRERAAGSEGVWVADMPDAAQATRVYAEYLEATAADAAPPLLAVAVVGPRTRVDRLTKGLGLLP